MVLNKLLDIDSFMLEHRYNWTSSNHYVFFKILFDGDLIILLMYADEDEMLASCQDTNQIEKLKRELSKSFAMKNFKPDTQILGTKITEDRANKKLLAILEKHIQKVLDRFNQCSSHRSL